MCYRQHGQNIEIFHVDFKFGIVANQCECVCESVCRYYILPHFVLAYMHGLIDRLFLVELISSIHIESLTIK